MTTSFADVNRIFGIIAGYIDFIGFNVAFAAIRKFTITMATIQDIFGAILAYLGRITRLQKRLYVSHLWIHYKALLKARIKHLIYIFGEKVHIQKIIWNICCLLVCSHELVLTN